MTQGFSLKCVTPERLLLAAEVVAVTLPIAGGEVTILSKHEPYIGALQAGEITIERMDGTKESLAVSGGFVECEDNVLSVLADTAERAEEIDIERAETARERAEILRKEAISLGDEEYARVAAVLEKEVIRLKVARKHRAHTGLQILSTESE